MKEMSVVNIGVFGSKGAGKTSLIERFSERKADVEFKVFDAESSVVSRNAYAKLQAAVIVFDVTDRSSSEYAFKLCEDIRRRGPEDIHIAIVGTKTDLGIGARQVSYREVEDFLYMQNFLGGSKDSYVEASAKDGTNVDGVFQALSLAKATGAPHVSVQLPPVKDDKVVIAVIGFLKEVVPEAGSSEFSEKQKDDLIRQLSLKSDIKITTLGELKAVNDMLGYRYFVDPHGIEALNHVRSLIKQLIVRAEELKTAAEVSKADVATRGQPAPQPQQPSQPAPVSQKVAVEPRQLESVDDDDDDAGLVAPLYKSAAQVSQKVVEQHEQREHFLREENSLFIACKSGHADVVEKLLKAGGDANAVSDSEWGDSLLHTACGYGHTEVVRVLLNHGANVNCVNSLNMTPFYYAHSSPLMKGQRFPEVIKLLMEKGSEKAWAFYEGAYLEAKENGLDSTNAHKAAAEELGIEIIPRGKDEKIEAYKERFMKGTPLSAARVEQQQQAAIVLQEVVPPAPLAVKKDAHSLVRAAAAGNLKEVRKILSGRGKFFSKESFQKDGGITQEVKNEALRVARGSDVRRALFENGAQEVLLPELSIKAKAVAADQKFTQPQSLAPQSIPQAENAQRLVHAAEQGKLKEVESLLGVGLAPHRQKRFQAENPIAGEMRDTALCLACQNGHADVVKALLTAYPEFNMGENLHKLGSTLGAKALYFACVNGHANVVQAIKENVPKGPKGEFDSLIFLMLESYFDGQSEKLKTIQPKIYELIEPSLLAFPKYSVKAEAASVQQPQQSVPVSQEVVPPKDKDEATSAQPQVVPVSRATPNPLLISGKTIPLYDVDLTLINGDGTFKEDTIQRMLNEGHNKIIIFSRFEGQPFRKATEQNWDKKDTRFELIRHLADRGITVVAVITNNDDVYEANNKDAEKVVGSLYTRYLQPAEETKIQLREIEKNRKSDGEITRLKERLAELKAQPKKSTKQSSEIERLENELGEVEKQSAEIKRLEKGLNELKDKFQAAILGDSARAQIKAIGERLGELRAESGALRNKIELEENQDEKQKLLARLTEIKKEDGELANEVRKLQGHAEKKDEQKEAGGDEKGKQFIYAHEKLAGSKYIFTDDAVGQLQAVGRVAREKGVEVELRLPTGALAKAISDKLGKEPDRFSEANKAVLLNYVEQLPAYLQYLPREQQVEEWRIVFNKLNKFESPLDVFNPENFERIINDPGTEPAIRDRAKETKPLVEAMVSALKEKVKVVMGLSENAIKAINLFDGNPDPFSFRLGNGLGKIFAAHREANAVPMPQIVEAIIIRPDLAAAFFKRRFFAFLPGRQNFRKELAQNPELIKTLIRSGDKEILDQMDKFLGATAFGSRYLSSAERKELLEFKKAIPGMKENLQRVLNTGRSPEKVFVDVMNFIAADRDGILDYTSTIKSLLDNKELKVNGRDIDAARDVFSENVVNKEGIFGLLQQRLEQQQQASQAADEVFTSTADSSPSSDSESKGSHAQEEDALNAFLDAESDPAKVAALMEEIAPVHTNAADAPAINLNNDNNAPSTSESSVVPPASPESEPEAVSPIAAASEDTTSSAPSSPRPTEENAALPPTIFSSGGAVQKALEANLDALNRSTAESKAVAKAQENPADIGRLESARRETNIKELGDVQRDAYSALEKLEKTETSPVLPKKSVKDEADEMLRALEQVNRGPRK